MPAMPKKDAGDDQLLAVVHGCVADTAEAISKVELRVGLRHAMRGAQAVNQYLNDLAPWKTAKTDEARTVTTLGVALTAIADLAVAFAPYLPFSSAAIDELFGFDGEFAGRGFVGRVPQVGAPLGVPSPLFQKIDL